VLELILSFLQVLLMSDALQVNEMDCLLCLLTGHEEVSHRPLNAHLF
jgi:hypothetical protein